MLQPKRFKLRYGRWFLLWLFVSSFGVHCLPLEERVCRTAADCVQNQEKPHCVKGICSKQECEPGQVSPCFQGQPKQEGVGICRGGERLCLEQGIWSRCEGQILAQREICDRVDNDCEGTIDQGPGLQCECVSGSKRECYAGPEKTQGVGTCRSGVQYCEQDQRWGRCYAQQVPVEEVCDQLDNNCNGSVDEGLACACVVGQTRPCYSGPPGTRQVGPCQAGAQTCQADGRWGKCQNEKLPESEVCDGIDNDCDGIVDGDILDCQGLTRCIQGQCRCPAPLQRCGNLCIDTQQNQEHCGACGNVCSAGLLCRDGKCQCSTQQTLCGGKCIDVSSDIAHCGQCNNPCVQGQLCRNGQCGACVNPKYLCGSVCCPLPGQCCGQACTDVSNSRQHCGACDRACRGGEICCAGACVPEDEKNCGICGRTCNVGQTCCGGVCADLKQNSQHCGTCGVACASGKTCCSGTCVAPDDPKHCGVCGHVCSSLQTCCSGVCVDAVSNNPQHCGACGSVCANDKPVCCSGSCVASLQSNAQHCGACGKACSGTDTCCGGACVDLKSTVSHCGACGKGCVPGLLCCDGACYAGTCPFTSVIATTTANALQWVKGIKIVRTSQGDFMVAGVFQGEFSVKCGGVTKQFSSTKHVSTADPTQDFFVARLNSSLVCQWILVGTSDADVSIADMKYLSRPGVEKVYLVGAVQAGGTFLQLDALKNTYSGGLKNQAAFLIGIAVSGTSVGVRDIADTELTLSALAVDSTSTYIAMVGESKGTLEFTSHVATPIKKVPASTSQSQAVLVLWSTVTDSILWVDTWSVSASTGQFQFLDVAFAEHEKKIYVTGQEGLNANQRRAIIRRYDPASGVSDGSSIQDPGSLKQSSGVRLLLEPIINNSKVKTRVFVAIETALQKGVLRGQRTAAGIYQTTLWHTEWGEFSSLPETDFVSLDIPNTRVSTMQWTSQGNIVLAGAFLQIVTTTSLLRGVYLTWLSSKGVESFQKFPSTEPSEMTDMVLDANNQITAVGWFSGKLDVPPASLQTTAGKSLWLWRYALVP